METPRIILYLLTLKKLNQIRKRSKEKQGNLQNYNKYGLREYTEMSSFSSVTKSFLE